MGKAIATEAALVDFVLDIFYLMDDTGVIPPYTVLNQVLAEGGDNGGMGPGTSWRPFQIAEDEYWVLRAELLHIDIAVAKEQHPYIRFDRIIEDEALDAIQDAQEWRQESYKRYTK